MLRPRLLFLLVVLAVVLVDSVIRRGLPSRAASVLAAVPVVSADGLRVAGRVLRDGAPLAGSQVQARGGAVTGHPVERVVTTDRDGRFDFGNLPLHEYEVVATAPGATFALELVGRARRERPVRSDQLVLDVSPCDQPLIGTVVDRDGAPIAGAEIGPAGRAVTRTGADGAFQICPAARRGFLAFHAPGHGDVVYPVSALSAPRRIELAPEAAIEGRLVLDGTAQPIAGTTVWVMAVTNRGDRSFGLGGTAATDRDGRFRIAGLAAGRAVLGAEAPGLPGHHLVDVVAGETRTDVVLRMSVPPR